MLVTGFMLLAASIYVTTSKSANQVAFTRAVAVQEIKVQKPKPTSISIPSLSIDLPVTDAAIKNGEWQVSSTGASHLETSANPGEGGNIVIYGHNLLKIFGKLGNLKLGDKIYVTNENGEQTTYIAEEKKVVFPDEVESVLPTETEQLTVYTCTGFADSQRLVFIAKPLAQTANAH